MNLGKVFHLSRPQFPPSANEKNGIYSLCQAPPDHLAFQMTFH